MAAGTEHPPLEPVLSKAAPVVGIRKSRRLVPASQLRAPLHGDVATLVTRNLLDRVQPQLYGTPDDVRAGMTELLSGLQAVKSDNDAETWGDVVNLCLSHPVRELAHQDPFTGRSFHKPRGYAGDAVMIDYIYSRTCRVSEAEEVSGLGEAIFAFTRDTPACKAVRSRRDLVAARIDDVCERVDRPRILSVACGHLREATLSRGVPGGRAARFVALDQDELSIRVVEQETAGMGVVPVCSSIKSLFRGPISAERFDFIYSTGLYDYLDARLATKLTQRMFEMLNPGGQLLVANFVPDIPGRGYMEAFMSWELIYRDAADMLALTATIDPAHVGASQTFFEENENIVFLELTRA